MISEDTGDPARDEATWDELSKHSRRRQEQLHRAIEERVQRGEDHHEAFENALRDIGLTVPGDEPVLDEDDLPTEDSDDDFDWSDDEAWAGDSPDDDPDDDLGEPDAPVEAAEWAARERHPLLRGASDLTHRLDDLFRDADPSHEAQLRVLFQGMGDLVGGLAQALSECSFSGFDDSGLRITQLKRALRGVAFALGALFPVRAALPPKTFVEVRQTLETIQRDVLQELARLRAERERGGGWQE